MFIKYLLEQIYKYHMSTNGFSERRRCFQYGAHKNSVAFMLGFLPSFPPKILFYKLH